MTSSKVGGHVYLLQTRESMRCGDSVFKVGCSTQLVLSVLEKIKDMAESIKRECGYDCTDKRLFQVRPVSDSLPVFEVLFDERDIHHYETETFRRRSTMKKKGKQTTTRGMKTTASRVS